jgi:DNA topoisomerase-1
VSVHDKKLARIVRQVRDLPGQELFQYLGDDGATAAISSEDVNAYLREIAGSDFTAKDFRTWEGTLACALALASDRVEGISDAKIRVVAAIKAVAERLGNTPAVCKKSYIHPGVIDEFLATGALALVERRAPKTAAVEKHALSGDESRILAFIENLSTRDETKHLGELLATSVRQAKKKRAAADPPLRTSTKRPRSAIEARA